MAGDLWKIALAAILAIPAVACRLGGVSLRPGAAVFIFGTGLAAASFSLAWAARVIGGHIRSTRIATVALVLVTTLPLYGVELYLSYRSGGQSDYARYAIANMTGSSRLLVGLGWPAVVLLFAFTTYRRGSVAPLIRLDSGRRVELAFLCAAALGAFAIAAKRSVSVFDALLLVALFIAFIHRRSQRALREPEADGLAGSLTELPSSERHGLVAGLILLGLAIGGLCAKPFAETLVHAVRGTRFDGFVLVQSITPFATECATLFVAATLASRGEGDGAIGVLLTSKLVLWTLLLAGIPIAHAVGGGGVSLLLDARQSASIFLTASQALFGISLLLRLRLRPGIGLIVLSTFVAQQFFPGSSGRLAFGVLYLGAAAFLVAAEPGQVASTLRALRSAPKQ